MFGRHQLTKNAKSAAGNLGAKRKVGLTIESLEERRLMAADMMANMAFVGPVQQPSPSPTMATSTFASPRMDFAILHLTDTVVDAKWVQVGTSNVKQFVIDGSDQDDVITVESYGNYFLNGPTFTVTLQKYNAGTLITSQRVSLSAGRGFVAHPTQPLLVYGRDGVDRISNLTGMAMLARGGNGNDTVVGGSGNDSLYGDAGMDTLYGQAGHDTIHGDSGVWDYYANFADTIYGGEGNDWLDGEAGDDRIYGEGGHDTILGSFGNDLLYGGVGNDSMYGEHGNDRIFGQDGIDRLYGGDHNDYLDGGYKSDPNSSIDQADILYGGAGKDTFARHRSTLIGLGSGDPDIFADYGSGDSTDNVFHW